MWKTSSEEQMMSPDPTALLKEALELPPGARAALAGSLLESLEPDADAEAEDAWRAEIQRRLHELDTRVVTPVPWTQARRTIAGE